MGLDDPHTGEIPSYKLYSGSPAVDEDVGYKTTTLQVGARGNKLNLLRELIETSCDGKFGIKSGKLDDNLKGEGYILQFTMAGVPYSVVIEYLGETTPLSKAYLHRATITLPMGEEDILTPGIRSVFEKYEREAGGSGVVDEGV
jgi:hypothetical protein